MRPPDLIRGDTVAIVAPSRKVTNEELRPAIQNLIKWEVFPILGNNIFNSDNQFSGTDQERADDLQSMLDDDTVRAIFFARGGYGALRIIDKLDFTEFLKAPKWLVGYSDITVFHSHIHKNFGVETLHATMPINFMKNAKALESLRATLFGEPLHYSFSANTYNKNGSAEGMVVGGNISLLFAMLGSSSDVNTDGKILFIEDLDEYLYHLDRMMVSLKRAKKLDKLAGLLVGGLTAMKDNQVPFGKFPEEIILDAVKEYDYPVCFDFPAGHQDENLALILGRCAKLKVESFKVELSYLSNLV